MGSRNGVGLRRLAIVTIIPWIIAWAAVLITTELKINDLNGQISQLQEAYARPMVPSDREIAEIQLPAVTEVYVRVRPWPRIALLAGLGGPLAGIAVVAAALWVRRGFAAETLSN